MATTLRQWFENRHQYRARWSNCHDYYLGFVDNENNSEKHIYLAKIIQFNVSDKHVKDFFMITRRQFRQLRFMISTWCKIQIGDTSDPVTKSNYTFKHVSSNVKMVKLSRLLVLPVPIDADAEFSVNKKDTSNVYESDLENNKWIISDDIYKKGVETCLKALYLAKIGDWKSFQALDTKTQVYHN